MMRLLENQLPCIVCINIMMIKIYPIKIMLARSPFIKTVYQETIIAKAILIRNEY